MPINALDVHLPTPSGLIRVGTLHRDPAGTVTFVIADAYVDMGPRRPVLSLAWLKIDGEEKTIAELQSSNGKKAFNNNLPPFFSNLLPEGALRIMVEREMGSGRHGDFDVLARLGRDLPGALIVVPQGVDPTRIDPGAGTEEKDKTLIRFSLAGVQPKWSIVPDGSRLTMPGTGQDGPLIAKFGYKDVPDLPELEFSAMKLARAAGIDVADCSLHPKSDVVGLPDEILRYGDSVLAVRRFDRSEPDKRVHLEDFAQIVQAVGDQKYTYANTDTCIKISGFFSTDPTRAYLEAIRRVVVNILLGNNDAHLKNWAMLLPADGSAPILSPAYDITPTVAMDGGLKMALKLSGAAQVDTVNWRHLTRVAGFLKLREDAVESEARRTVKRAAEAWSAMIPDLPLSARRAHMLARLWSMLPITDGIASPFPTNA